MKTKINPAEVQTLDNLEYHCLKGLNKKQKEWAKEQIKHFKEIGYEDSLPIGIIRSSALKIK